MKRGDPEPGARLDVGPPVDEVAPNGERYLVRSVARALQLLELVSDAAADGLSLSDLSRSLSMSKSATFSLVRTLSTRGYLRESEPGPRYLLGLALMRLGDTVAHQLPLGELCRPILVSLTEQTHMTSRAAVADSGYPVFIERVDGPGSVRFHTPLGRRESPHASAAGKAILATMSADEVHRLVTTTGLAARTRHTITEESRLHTDLEQTRRRGYALDDEEDAEGVFCVGAAFYDHAGRCAGALSSTGIKLDLPAWRVEELGRTLREHSDRLTALLGGRPPTSLAPTTPAEQP
ncbi:MAG: IclR family transcriptional regulator [Actinomycetes bacterium]